MKTDNQGLNIGTDSESAIAALNQFRNAFLGWCASTPTHAHDIHVARPNFIAKEAQLVRAVLAACKRSAHYAVENLDEWIDYAAEFYRTDRATAERAIIRELPHLHLDGEVDVQGLQEMIELQRRLGAVERHIEVEEISDFRFVPLAEKKSENLSGSQGLSQVRFADGAG